MSFDINGYLGKEAEEIMEVNTRNHQTLFSFCEELNRFAISISSRVKIHQYNSPEITIGGLYIKILNSTQSAILLSKYGLEIEAQVILRTALESLFWLAALVDDPLKINHFINSHEKQRDKLVSKISQHPECFHDSVVEQTKKYVSEYDKSQDVGIAYIATKAGFKDVYDNVYTSLCWCTHPDIKNIESSYYEMENGELVSFNTLPTMKSIERILSTVAFIQITLVERMSRIWELQTEKGLAYYHSKYSELFHEEGKYTI